MEQLILMAMQTCIEYAQKSSAGPLTEYEVQMYERMCRLVTTYTKHNELVVRAAMPEAERNALQAEAEHRQWLDAHDEEKE